MFTAHTHIYIIIYICIYTLGVGDSFKKPWLHDRCFFKRFPPFPRCTQTTLAEGSLWAISLEKLIVGVMDRYWDYKSMTCDDNID